MAAVCLTCCAPVTMQRTSCANPHTLLHRPVQMPPSARSYLHQLREMAKGLPVLSYFAQEPEDD